MFRSRVNLGIALGFSLALIVVFGNPLTWALLYTIILMALLSVGLTALTLRRLVIVQELPGSGTVKGDAAVCNIIIRNRMPLPCGLIRLHFAETTELLCGAMPLTKLTLMPLTRLTGGFDLRGRFCGTFPVGVDQIQITDFLGLVTFHKIVGEQQVLTVFPRILPIPEQTPTLVSMDVQARQTRLEDDYSTIVDYRQYVNTDHMKRVHWKLSAKKNEWIVKNYGSTADISTVILLDLSPLPYGDLECQLELADRMTEGAVALLNDCVEREEPTDFLYGGETVTSLSVAEAGFVRLYDLCAGLAFTSELGVAEVLDEYNLQKQEAAGYQILTAVITESIYESLSVLYHSGRSVTVYLFAAAGAGPGLEQQLAELGVPVRVILPGQDIRDNARLTIDD